MPITEKILSCFIVLCTACMANKGVIDDVNYDEVRLMHMASPRLHAISGISGLIYYYVLYTQRCFYDPTVSSLAFYF